MTDAVYMIVPFVVVVVGFGVLAYIVLFDRKAKQQAERDITTNLLDQLYSLEASDIGRSHHEPNESKHGLKESADLSSFGVASDDAINELLDLYKVNITTHGYRSTLGEIQSAKAELAKEVFLPFRVHPQTNYEECLPVVNKPLMKRARKFRARNVELRKHSV
ncbi:hypothetical protein [Vibrio splendidus]|uniref:hypothetical protein n=1 Tax=Vibrio splendidus TaxID=29497 RepID=UPI000376F846|nr:hypothetical protein [Vibrio splendidus]